LKLGVTLAFSYPGHFVRSREQRPAVNINCSEKCSSNCRNIINVSNKAGNLMTLYGLYQRLSGVKEEDGIVDLVVGWTLGCTQSSTVQHATAYRVPYPTTTTVNVEPTTLSLDRTSPTTHCHTLHYFTHTLTTN